MRREVRVLLAQAAARPRVGVALPERVASSRILDAKSAARIFGFVSGDAFRSREAELAAARKGMPKLAVGRPRRIFPREEALRLRQLGWSWRDIEKHLGVPNSTLRSALKAGAHSLQMDARKTGA